MHLWGDTWKYWEDLGAAIDMAYNLATEYGLPSTFMKEKYGTMRWYYSPETDADKKSYRLVYEQIVEAYPHLADELLASADGGELLVGIIDPKDCKHEQVWTTHENGKEPKSHCGTCMMEIKEEV